MHSLLLNRLCGLVCLISCHVSVWQTCYNRCVNNDEPTTATIPFPYTHTQSLSTVSMSTNASILVFREDTKATGTSAATTTSAYVTSVISELPDTELCRRPVSYVSAFTLSIIWHVVYWTSQALTWFAIRFSFTIIVTVR